jgi:uncharacterized protein (TIGR02646 family)
MRKINKRIEPPKVFLERKAAIYATHEKTLSEKTAVERAKREIEGFNAYGELDKKDKDILRKALAEDQGFLCVYCEQRLKVDGNVLKDVKIEHFKPQSIYKGAVNDASKNKYLCDDEISYRKNLTLDYDNLFLACSGMTSSQQHCDTSKGNYELCHLKKPSTWSAADEIFIKFDDGKITSDNLGIKTELNGTINLQNNKLTNPKYLNLNNQKLIEIRQEKWNGLIVTINNKFKKSTGLDITYKTWESGGKVLIQIARFYKKRLFEGYQRNNQLYYFEFRSSVLYQLDQRFKGRL